MAQTGENFNTMIAVHQWAPKWKSNDNKDFH